MNPKKRTILSLKELEQLPKQELVDMIIELQQELISDRNMQKDSKKDYTSNKSTALQNWYDGFPVEDIINKVEALGVEEITKAVKEQLQTTVQDWLKELKDMRDASRELNIDLLRAASSLARKDRERVE